MAQIVLTTTRLEHHCEMSKADWAIVHKVLEVIFAHKLLFKLDFPLANLSLDEHSKLTGCLLHINFDDCIDCLCRLLILLDCYGQDHRLLLSFVFTAAL